MESFDYNAFGFLEKERRIFELKQYVINEKLPLLDRSDASEVQRLLDDMRDGEIEAIYNLPMKSPKMAVILSVFLGMLGADMFYLGKTKLGIVKLITLGGLGIWWLVDIFRVDKFTRRYNKSLIDNMHK